MVEESQDQETQGKWDRYRRERSDRLDAILRRINKVGLDHLTEEEVACLERISAELAREIEGSV